MDFEGEALTRSPPCGMLSKRGAKAGDTPQGGDAANDGVELLRQLCDGIALASTVWAASGLGRLPLLATVSILAIATRTTTSISLVAVLPAHGLRGGSKCEAERL